jgi:amino acid adenylation domain-containing protein
MSQLLPELFLEQARARPQAPAVLCGHGTVSYRDLERSARRIAGALTARGVGPESTVGVLVPPGPDMVAALLGSWLAGGCYVPLDPIAPAHRLRETAELAGARVVLVAGRPSTLDPGLPPDAMLCDITRLAEGQPAGHAPRPDRITRPRQAAYMIFTSGSTGTPKGVVVEHEGIANRVLWGVRELGLSPADRVLQKTPLTFDAAGWEIFAPLACGAPVTFGRADAGRDPGELVASIRERQATVVQVVPSMLRLLATEPGLAACASLRLICSAGEPLQAELCQQILERVDVEIVNTYGPTECAIDVLAARFDRAQRSGPVPIGSPIDNMRCLLLPPDEDDDGAAGGDDALRELYASGPGVARGYHGDAARTAERFLPDPSGPPGARMYRTGDLVRRRADGALEFVGRADAQVKINGVRIEPGEVEAALETHPEVVEAAVKAVTDAGGTPRLAAWVVPARPDVVSGLPGYLRDRLPPGMVPVVITALDTIPRTVSGKKDRARLPGPDWRRPGRPASGGPAGGGPAGDGPAGGGPAPNGQLGTAEDRIVLAAWRQVLDTEEVDLDDDFFRLGGHSLLMTKLAAALADASGFGLDFRELHYTPTARGQAELLRTAVRAQPIDRLAAGARRPLSSAQERFWVLDRIDPGSREYLQPILIWLPAEVPAAVVEEALARIVARHEVLRTRYVMDAEGLAAVVEPAVDMPLRTADTTPDLVGKVVAGELADGFDLGRAPLLRATLVRDGGAEQLLLLVCHHIICDGWSARLLDREVREAVAATVGSRAPDLPSLTIGYTDAVAWQRAQLTEEVLGEQLGYWRDALAGLPPLDVPAVRERDAHRRIDGGGVGVDIPPSVAGNLLAAGRGAGAPPHVVFLTLWTILLARAAGQWDFGVGTPHAGRYRPELHDLVGLFMDVLVVRSPLAPEMSFADALAAVADTCREAFAHHAVPFEAVLEAVGQPRDPSRTPLFQTLFTLAGDDLVGQRHRERDLELLEQAWLVARTDLALTLWPDPDGRYRGVLEYASALYDKATATSLAGQLATLAEQFAADPDLALGAAALTGTGAGGSAPNGLAPHQETILGMIRELFKQDGIGLDDDVMARGGTSLLAARLLWNVANTFGVEVSMRVFFDRPTAAGLADEVERLLRAELTGAARSDEDHEAR